MKLMVASYNNGAVDWNAEAEETKIRSYSIDHQLNKPAKCMIKLYDPDGTILQKYNADANDVYLGVGKLTLEDPTGTDLFYGRIMKATGNFGDRSVTLECEDWLSQLDEEITTYDMREKLGTTDLRQSTGRSDSTNLTVAEDAGGGIYNFYDDGEYNDAGGMAFANDAYNGWKMFFTTEMAGTRTWKTYAYKGVDAGGPPTYADDWYETWTNDDLTDRVFDNADWTLVYTFAAELGHNTPSDFYVHDSISSASVHIKYRVLVTGAGNHVHMSIYDNNAAAYVDLHHMEETTDDVAHEDTLTISKDILPFIVDANGEINIEFDGDRLGGSCDLIIWYCWIEITTETTGYTGGVTINDTMNPNKLVTATNLATAATQVWEGIPYCIAKPIYLHLDTAESVGLSLFSDEGGDKSGTGPDPVIALTAAATVEHTTGYSTRQYKDMTRFAMVRDLAAQDKASFWVTLGGVTVTYKKTFGADTAQITDSDVESWQSLHDYSSLVNSMNVYGARIGDYEINQQAENAANITKFLATRSKVLKNSGLVSDASAFEVATNLAARDSEILQMVTCSIRGLDSTYRLGTITEITSSYLWPTAAKDYIVTRWSYDSDSDMSQLQLQPKKSTGLQEVLTDATKADHVVKGIGQAEVDKTIPDPVTHEVP